MFEDSSDGRVLSYENNTFKTIRLLIQAVTINSMTQFSLKNLSSEEKYVTNIHFQ